MKKWFAFALIMCLVIGALSGCGSKNDFSDEMEFELLEWPPYDNAKQIPVPKSSMADVQNKNDVRFSFYLANTTFEDFTDYVAACKEKGFTVDPIEQDNRYYAFNNDRYELTVEYHEGDIMYVSVVEERFDVEIKLLHSDKASAKQYDIRIEIDGYWEEDSEKGDEVITFDAYLKEGPHTLTIENDDDKDVCGRIDFVVSEDGEYFEYTIECLSNKIYIGQPSDEKILPAPAETSGAEETIEETTFPNNRNDNNSHVENEPTIYTEETSEATDEADSSIGIDPYEGAVKVCQRIKNSLNNPDSLQIHEVLYVTYNGCDYYYIDLSAMNMMGGYTRTRYYAMFMDAVLFKLEEMESFSYEDIINSKFDDLDYLDTSTIVARLK